MITPERLMACAIILAVVSGITAFVAAAVRDILGSDDDGQERRGP